MDRNSIQRLDELSRAYVKSQGEPRQRYQKENSESKAVMSLQVLTEERTQHKEWHAIFVNVLPQVRPGIRDILKYTKKHKDEPWTEEDFDIAMHDDRHMGQV